jgi:hypothetical protein
MLREFNHRATKRRAAGMVNLRASIEDTRGPEAVSDSWTLEWQARAETEKEAWRRLHEEWSAPRPSAMLANDAIDHRKGSAMLTALVRFGLATFGAHVARLAATASQIGEFEIWLAMAAGFAIAPALSMFGYARGFAHLLARAPSWMIVSAVSASALWLAF